MQQWLSIVLMLMFVAQHAPPSEHCHGTGRAPHVQRPGHGDSLEVDFDYLTLCRVADIRKAFADCQARRRIGPKH